MALMNVACEQAKKKKVLVVDFYESEAPGLTTFAPCRSAQGRSGIVEYLIEYKSTNASPRAQEYIYKCDALDFARMDTGKIETSSSEEGQGSSEEGKGELHVMPAGNMHAAYGSKFGQIDWGDLYQNRDGFLLIENLKAQWRAIGFDYVFIDSRTGHTDSSGICTRQLPDALVAVFSPNEQNLLGLKVILDEVRNDTVARNVEREFIFVASRVPQLDDEHRQLENMLKRFQFTLKYASDNFAEIHNYDSLALVTRRYSYAVDRGLGSQVSTSISRLCLWPATFVMKMVPSRLWKKYRSEGIT